MLASGNPWRAPVVNDSVPGGGEVGRFEAIRSSLAEFIRLGVLKTVPACGRSSVYAASPGAWISDRLGLRRGRLL